MASRGRGRGRRNVTQNDGIHRPTPSASRHDTLPVVMSSSHVDADYNWDPERLSLTSSLRELRLGGGQEENQTEHRPKDKATLTNFFEFATKEKDVPKIPPNNLSNIGVWTNPGPEAANGAAGGVTTVTSDLDEWGDPGKLLATQDDEEYEKKYIHHYKQEMDDKIASAQTSVADQVKNALAFMPENTSISKYDDKYSLFGTIPPAMPMGGYDEVWDQYDTNVAKYARETEQLPVYKIRHDIMSAIESNQVTIIEGFTGCGKTTQIPQYILEKHCILKTRCNVVVTQPRRLAAVSVANRVCDEKGWDVGSVVGYQVGLNRRTSPLTRLTYVTTGILLQSLISKKSLDEYSHIIVDEVHERDLETDLLLLILKKILVERVDKTTKVILMSATLNAQKFADYFPKWPTKADVEIKAAILRIPPESIYPVDEIYLDPTQSASASAAIEEMTEPKVHETCYKLAIDFIIKLDQVEMISENVGAGERGGVLIFLPGFLEIETMCTMLAEAMHIRARDAESPLDYKWTVLPLHSTITSEEQQRVFHRVSSGYRKIVVATNIAESSITVTDMRYVVDFCLTKSLGYDHNTNYTCLRMEWASQDQCTQRRGRVGRVAQGIVYRLVTHEFWDSLGKETIPDMEKSSLENVVLKVKNLNMGSPKSNLALAIDPPKISLISRAVAHLKEVGALTINTGTKYTQYNGDLTPMGIVMSKLPLDVRFSRLIVLGHVFGVLEEAIIIAAGMCGKSPFSYPFSNRLGSFMSKLSWSTETFSDCFAILCLLAEIGLRPNHNTARSYVFRGIV